MVTNALIWQFSLIFIAVLSNGFFVAAEFALARTRASQIDSHADKSTFHYKILSTALSQLNDYISAAQIGITIASLIMGALSESLFSHLFHEFFLFALPSLAIESVSFVCAIATATLIHVIIGEFIPKTLAIQKPEKIAELTIIPLFVFYKITQFLVYILNSIALFILKPFGINTLATGELSYSEDEIKYLIKQSEREGIIEESEREMVDNVFEFGDTVVREVMTPRTEIIGIENICTIKQASQICITQAISKLPVYEDNLDNIIGSIRSKELLSALSEEKDNDNIESILRPVLKVPENKSISDLLTEFKTAKTKIALVIDEFGGTSGLVTLEDLLEELVGDLSEEQKDQNAITKLENNSWQVSGATPISEINEILGSDFSNEHFDTIGGYVFGLIGHEPEIHDSIDDIDSSWKFTITKKNRRIEEVLLTFE